MTLAAGVSLRTDILTAGTLVRMNRSTPRAFSECTRDWAGRFSYCLLPPRCLVCKQPGMAGCDLCVACHAALPWNDCACIGCALPLPTGCTPGMRCGECLRRAQSAEQVAAAFVYAPPVDGLLRRFKFHQDLAAGHLLSGLMGQSFSAQPLPDALMPIPLHRARLRQRGYDQARELAKPLARTLGIPLLDGLRRVQVTEAQSGLDAAARMKNVRGAFSVNRSIPPHVMLVDDVMTTGATFQAARKALLKAGAKRVDGWFCARVP